MDMLILALIGVGILAGAALFGSDDGDETATDPTPDSEGATEPGSGGYGPDGTYDLIWGTEEANELEGGDEKEVMLGYAGNDTLMGGNENDRIFGHSDDDSFGGTDNDYINPGAGDDEVFGARGNDIVSGGFIENAFGDAVDFRADMGERIADEEFSLTDEERENITNTSLVDVADDFGNDLIRGEDGNDIIADAIGQDTLYGDLGADLLISVDKDTSPTEDIADEVYGGFGSDTLMGDDGDTLVGGDGVDHYIIANGLNAKASDDEDLITIQGFDAALETIQIETDEAGLSEVDLSISTDGSGGTFILLDGEQVVHLVDVSVAAIGDLSIEVNAPDPEV